VSPLASPKQPPQERLKDWYPYYAGFTSVFAEGVFDEYLGSARSVVDPWNGSGTTTAVAAARRVNCLGVDVNPALTIVARARLTPRSIADSLIPIAAEIVSLSDRKQPLDREVEPLSTWLLDPSVSDIRKLQRAIHIVTSADALLEVELAQGVSSAPTRLPLITAFFYAALFASCRDLLRPFRGSNPTWLVAPDSLDCRLRPDTATIQAVFLDRVRYLCVRLSVEETDAADLAEIRTEPAEALLSGSLTFDACLTSPPYATRIDYIRGSIPELSVLGLSTNSISVLRRESTGTPVVRGVNVAKRDLPAAASELVDRVASHGSHGSASYYAPWLRNYLTQLNGTLGAIAASVRPSGRIALVVQDSYYKSIHIDLQELVQLSLAEFGRRLLDRHDFEVTRSMSYMNPRAREHLPSRTHRESLLVFD
jgi:hypothetical protein